MAEETEQAPNVELEPAVVPAEEGGEAQKPGADADAAPEPLTVEALAQDLGWTPKDQFRGDPDQWKPADQFIRDGRDIQRNLTRDVKGLKDTVSNMARTSAALLEQQLAAQRAELETRFQEAVDQGDAPAARQITTQLAELETQKPDSAPPTPEGQAFAERNKWFGSDREATAYAISRAGHYAQQGLSASRQLQAVERDMKDIFPDLFPAPAKQPPAVAAPTSRTASTGGRAKSFHDLPPEAQKVAKDMVERGVIPTTDLYVANYFKQEKVG